MLSITGSLPCNTNEETMVGTKVGASVSVKAIFVFFHVDNSREKSEFVPTGVTTVDSVQKINLTI